MTDMANWITNIQPSEGSGNATVTVSMQNNSGGSREATIRVKGNGVPDSTFTLTQQAVSLYPIQLYAKTSSVQPYEGASNPDAAMGNTYLVDAYATEPADSIGVGTIFYTSSTAVAPLNGGSTWYKLGGTMRAVMIGAAGYFVQEADTSQSISLPSSVSFSASGESKQVNVTSNTSWTVSSKPSWITISNGSGIGNGSFTATAQNNTGDSRNGPITVRSSDGLRTATMNASQAASASVEGVFPSDISASATGDFYYAEVRAASGVNWQVSLPPLLPPGFAVTPMSGSGTTPIRIDVPANHFSDPLIYTFDVNIGGTNYSVTINQQGQP